jgi:hypothetical protein
MIWRFD